MASKLVIRNLAELDEGQQRQAVEIFAASFYEPLAFLSPEIEKIADTLEHAFLHNHFYAGLLEGNVVGIVACSTREQRSHRFNRTELVRHLGPLKGTMAYLQLRNVYEKPFQLQPHQCCIEWVATDSAYRGKGISRRIQQYLLEELPYEEFVLQVMNTNYSAIRLYEKLGFTIYDRKPYKPRGLMARSTDFSECIFMKKAAPKTQIAK